MWAIDTNTMAVTMHKGDTGAYWVNLSLSDESDSFVDGDVAIYEVWQGNTAMLEHREFNLQPETPTEITPGNGRFLIAFRNSDTDTLAAGSYRTEIRVALNPVRASGKVKDGNLVRTVVQSTISILDVLIDI